jgi:hypothetical protein
MLRRRSAGSCTRFLSFLTSVPGGTAESRAQDGDVKGEDMLRDRGQPLLGCPILVVDDEYFLADDLRPELEALGANVIRTGRRLG